MRMNADAIAALLQGMNKGQYEILAMAIAQLGGELRLSADELAVAAMTPASRIEVDDTDGPIILRLVG
jgi:hypothetical protein